MKLEELVNAPKHSQGTFLERYWRSVRKSDGCWEWIGYKVPKGYGKIKANNKIHIASRMAYLIEHGEIDDSLGVLHSCDNPSCVNPKHLRLGTNADNANDCKSRGRHCIGEKNGFSKVKAADVRAIREKAKTDSFYEIADRFGVSYACVWDIVRGRSWTHIK